MNHAEIPSKKECGPIDRAGEAVPSESMHHPGEPLPRYLWATSELPNTTENGRSADFATHQSSEVVQDRGQWTRRREESEVRRKQTEDLYSACLSVVTGVIAPGI